MTTKFSNDGKYFAQITSNGKIVVWDVQTNSFEQEFTPDFHLTSPCTCLDFINYNKVVHPRKKRFKGCQSEPYSSIIFGTKSGILLLYSIAKAKVEYTIDDNNNNTALSCISICDSNEACSGADHNIIIWDINKKTIISKWSSGNDKITAILKVDSQNLLTASKGIKLWNPSNKELLKSFTGHSSQIHILKYIPPTQKNDVAYCISCATNDRILSCWNLTESSSNKNAVANFLMEDCGQYLSTYDSPDGASYMAVTLKNGAVQIYQHTFNGICIKPIKPKSTIHIVSDSKIDSEQILPIHIFAAIFKESTKLCIGYGTLSKCFESIDINFNEKIMCITRCDPEKIGLEKQKMKSKILTSVISKNSVSYLTPQTRATVSKRKVTGAQNEIPMEQRLENLTLNTLEGGNQVPKNANVAQLLIQGLSSKDRNILRTALYRKDEDIMKNTVKRLPIQAVIPLVEELITLINGKTLASCIGSLWLRQLIFCHAAVLVANPKLSELLTNVLGAIDARLSLHVPLNRLRGRLELFSSQISNTSMGDNVDTNDVLIFNDKDSSDSDKSEAEDIESESGHEWFEESEKEEEDICDVTDDEEDHNSNDMSS